LRHFVIGDEITRNDANTRYYIQDQSHVAQD
jgi:hypothetical protein